MRSRVKGLGGMVAVGTIFPVISLLIKGTPKHDGFAHRLVKGHLSEAILLAIHEYPMVHAAGLAGP